ncbi:hypothetical protein [Mycoplasma struthionis]|uniref:DUF1292 domain-containing protein n=1 Tax=Mycoplasma struthionis TaxID=538220 RepID=A0A3G8LHP4_9MOLU|nr:hypothetical protein [Mycoplasma struthionis]AZG68884.1 hypothetical protein EGN60_02945 [Mycoplasma struthionis]TPI01286.1 hypothetical protein FJM01_02825 [Mycoplasma struthionis]
MAKNKVFIINEQRAVEIANEKLYVIFDFFENGEHYLALTNKEGIIFAKEKDNLLSEVDDEAEIDILTDILYEFSLENEALDENNEDILAKLVGEDEE